MWIIQGEIFVHCTFRATLKVIVIFSRQLELTFKMAISNDFLTNSRHGAESFLRS
jgi:hypothetical protein